MELNRSNSENKRKKGVFFCPLRKRFKWHFLISIKLRKRFFFNPFFDWFWLVFIQISVLFRPDFGLFFTFLRKNTI